MDRVEAGGLRVARVLYDFVNDEAIPGTGADPERFWQGFGALVHALAPRNRALLGRRDALQARIDAWHGAHCGRPIDQAAYEAFLREIGYLEAEPAEGAIATANVDPEIARVAGPQLVVPVTNARYALNAANARWGSLYDALYGTDAISEVGGAGRGPGYNPGRGARVIARARAFLDEAAPLERGSHADATGYAVAHGRLVVSLEGARTGLREAGQLVGFRGGCWRRR
jgi:malate synthase